jgi:hypothetical protein
LAADLAVKPAAAGLLVQLDFDRLFVVAEEACEGRRERVALAEREGVSLRFEWARGAQRVSDGLRWK